MNPIPLTLTLGLTALGALATTPAPDGHLVAIKAGKIHTMDAAGVIENGTLLVRDGKIVAVGTDVDVPPSAEVVDYGPYADVIPGLVAASSGLGRGAASERSADLGLFAVDNVDPYSNRADLLAAGVTSAYVDTTGSRFLSGVGGVVKLGGDPAERVVDSWAAIDGSVTSSAYNTRGYWVPPVPATVDVGMGVEEPQLPKSLPGAIMALGMLSDMAAGKDVDAGFGPHLQGDLQQALEKGAMWRFSANDAVELRALASFAKEREVQLVVDGAWEADEVAKELKAAGVGVIFEPRQRLGAVTNWGKGEDADWPNLEIPMALVEAGVPVAVATGSSQNLTTLYQTAMMASGGLDREQALALVTRDAAKLIGADDRVGSLRAGKDADFVVLSGAPMTAGSAVHATWVNGGLAFNAKDVKRDGKSKLGGAVVLEVEELHVGDGKVLRPGQVLMVDGRVREVGTEVAHPRGVTVIRGAAAMPGIVDGYGHLGLQGSRSQPPTGTSMSRYVMPGDRTAKRVAENGVTTVMLAPYSISGSGTTLTAYKPAEETHTEMVIEDTAAIHIPWSSNNAYGIGDNVRSMLQRAVDYDKEWREYEAAMAKWTPPPAEEEADEEDEAEDEEESEEEDPEKAEKEREKAEKERDKVDPMTGVWTADEDWGKARFQFKDEAAEEGVTEVRGSLRSDALSDHLMRFEGTFDHDEDELEVHGTGAFRGLVIKGEYDDRELEGTIEWKGEEYAFVAARQSREYVVVKRPVRDLEEPEAEKAPKGKPKEPRTDPNLEPWRDALSGETSVIVTVDDQAEILAAVHAFEGVGIKPVLFGAREAYRVADQIAGRVKGVLPSAGQLRTGDGLIPSNRFADLQSAGIPVAFHSKAEEGASDLLMLANYAVVEGMSGAGAVRALTADAAKMMDIDDRVGRLAPGLDADVLLLSASPTELGVRVLRTWIGGEEVIR